VNAASQPEARFARLSFLAGDINRRCLGQQTAVSAERKAGGLNANLWLTLPVLSDVRGAALRLRAGRRQRGV
jgi:hypothetical protein